MTSRLIWRLTFPLGSNYGCAGYHCSSRYRKKLGLPARPNQLAELKQYPDFSYTDGRPAPVTPGQLKQIKRHRELAMSVVQHLKEIEFIEKRYEQKVNRKLEEKQEIIEGKLKPKGDALLKNKSA